MSDEEDFEPDDADQPRYKPLSEIDPSAINQALSGLTLLGDDPYLRMQAMNLGAVDPFIADLEERLLRRLIEEERTPLPDALFVSAQSQMWIFAAYELLRTWRQRASDMIKWHDNSGLEIKLRALEEDQGYRHFGRAYRASQIKKVIEDPSMIPRIRDDLRRVHILFGRLEALRVSLAKHEVRGRIGSVALAPGYGRINQWCGALDYELENGRYSMGYVNRREIADDIRGLLTMDELPTGEELASFDEYMKGPPHDLLD
ncbi:hypothetical protein [Thalassospira profundimaris]|nr:hypothetical protein [Thalassospira profundimaris]